MKKIIFFTLCFIFSFSIVQANSVSKIVPIMNKAALLQDDKIIIPVEVISPSDGVLSNQFDKLVLGKIFNGENLEIEIIDIEGSGIKNIELDNLTDSESKSNLYFYLNDQLSLKSGETVMKFKIQVIFKEKVPDTLYVLGNEIFITDNIDEYGIINDFDVTNLKQELENKESNKLYIVLVISLSVLILVGTIFVLKNKR